MIQTTTLRIYDSVDHMLTLDLRHLIELLKPQSLIASWTVSAVEMTDQSFGDYLENVDATGEGGIRLDELALSGLPTKGTLIANIANDTKQVIWGKFTASLHGQDDWVIIQAIDSTFYEITTADAKVLSRVKATYKDVRTAVGPAGSRPIPAVERGS